MNKNKKKVFCSIVSIMVFFGFILLNTGLMKVNANPYYNAYEYNSTYGSNSCRFAVVEGEGRIYFGAYGTKGSKQYARYKTIGWKANLFQNGVCQESVYFSLNGSYVRYVSNITVNNVEYILFYIPIDSLIDRFHNQSAINSGTGQLKLDSVMSVINGGSDSANGWINDDGSRGGEVYEDYNGIAKARGWSNQTISDLHTNFNKEPTGMYFNVTVNGGTGISSTSGGGTYIYGARATIGADCAAGYDFDKWSNGKTSSKFSYAVKSDVSFSCSAKPKKYTVSYDANGGTGAPDSQIKTYGSVLTLSGTSPSKTGYLFDYWDGSDGNSYKPNAAFGTDADTKLTAHWTPITYYVSYNANKPSKASSPISGSMNSSTHTYDSPQALTGLGYSLKGWSFTNWNTKADNSGDVIYDGGYVNNMTTTNKATVPIYAQWKPNVYTLLLDEQYATTSGTPALYEKYDHEWYKEREAKNTTTKISVPSKIGMRFCGYFAEKDGKGTKYIDASGNIVAKANAFDKDDTIVYAYWLPNVYDITLDNQKATKAGTKHIYEKYSVGFYTSSVCTAGFINGKITVPKKDNYIFDGYWTEQNTWTTSHGEEIIQADGTINNVNTKFKENTTLFAKWIPEDYKINLDSQDADIDKGSPAFYEKYGEFNYTSTAEIAQYSVVEKYFNYTGSVQSFTAPCDGEYLLETAGAQGGKENDAVGGLGGSASGKITLKKGQTIYICVGGAGSWNDSSGGYNGGGASGPSGPSGGGATHIATTNRGVLKNYASYKNEILLVAGGGGGSTHANLGAKSNGGSGGGTSGNASDSFNSGTNWSYITLAGGGTQTSGGCAGVTKYENNITLTLTGEGGSFGQGGKGISSTAYAQYMGANNTDYGAGGGGGYYGGGSSCTHGGAGGGSGYIGGVTNGTMSNSANSGNGWAKITYTDTSMDSTSICSIRVPQKTGYTFDGYWTGKNGTGIQVIDYKGDVWNDTTYFDVNNTRNKETTIYASWTNNGYKVVYNANGGSSSSYGTSVSDSVKYDANYTVRSRNTFSRTGYTFKEWNEKQDGSGKAWTAGSYLKYSIPHGTTLYAIWQPNTNTKYTINYYKQNLDGTYNKTASATETRTGTTDTVVKVSPTTDKSKFNPTGFELDKTRSYSTPIADENSNGILSVKILGDGSTTVNYYYSRKSYTVTLEAASGDKGFKKFYGAGTYKYGATVEIQADLNDKFEFVSWKYKNGGKLFSTSSSASMVMPAQDVTLVAYSNSKPNVPTPEVKKYTVTIKHYFKGNDGKYALKDTTSDAVEKNKLYIPQYKKNVTGYHSVKMENNKTKANAAGGIIVTKDVTINAYYDPNTYRICTKYYVNSRIYDVLFENASYGESYKVKELDLKGYQLDSKKPMDIPIYNANPFTVKQDMLGANAISVYYVAKSFKVTFNANSGTITDNNKQVTQAERGVKYDSTNNNNVSTLKPSKTGYTFLGWYTEKDGGSQVYNANGVCVNDGDYWKNNKWCAESDLTVYAHWKANMYTLTFDANGGFVYETELTASCTPTYDASYFNNVSYLEPVRTGYTFLGWYTKDGKTQVYDEKGQCKNDGTYWKSSKWHYTGNVTLYAHWKANQYTVTYNANGGTGTMEKDTATFDSNYTTKANGFSRTGYNFVGWNEKPDGSGTDWTSRIGKPFKWNYTNNVTLYAQWQGKKATICYHSEDEKHNITKEYQVGAGQKFETASDWWKKQKFTNAYDPGNCIFSGWTMKKGSTKDMYKENAAVPDELITAHEGSTIDLYSIWDKPDVTITPTKNNLSFDCNNKTWYKDPIELQISGTDQRYNVIGFDFELNNGDQTGNWRTTNKGKSLKYTLSTSQYYPNGLSEILNVGDPFTIKAWSEASTATSGTPMGTSDAVTVKYWIDYTPPELSYSVDANHNINATATDSQCGVDTIDLQSYRDGQWVSVNKATASSSQYGKFDKTFNLIQADYKYRYRLVATDHLGNSVTKGEFYVVPMTLTTSLTKLNGDTAYNGQTLEFKAGGDLNTTINVNITGYPESVKYEFANELGQVTDSHVVTYDSDGNVAETKQFLIPWQIEHDKDYYVKITAYRGNESTSTTEYVKLTDLDFSKFRSNIIYQSGQHD